MAEKGWHKAVRSADLLPGDIFGASSGREYVLVARLQSGEAVAFASHCPHQGTELEGATVWDNKIRCPRHQYIYDPTDGHNVFPTERFGPEKMWKMRPGYLPTYAVQEREGWVWVYEQLKPPPASYDPDLELPPEGAELEPEIDDEDEGPTEAVKTIKVRQGSTFELRLAMNPLPGNAWHVEVVGDLLEIVEEGLLTEDAPRWKVRIKAHDAGEDAIECRFRAPWDTDPSELRRYVVQVVPPEG